MYFHRQHIFLSFFLARTKPLSGYSCTAYNALHFLSMQFLLLLMLWILSVSCATNTHTHTRLTALCPGLPGWAGTRKVKPIWILLKQETVSGSGISWAICKCAPRSRQIATPAPHHSVFLQAGCPSCHPTNSVKALKDTCTTNWHITIHMHRTALHYTFGDLCVSSER